MTVFTPEMLVLSNGLAPIHRYVIDRDTARALLDPECNRGNRHLVPGVWKKYLAEMESGRWLWTTHSPLKLALVDGDWLLIDGQHTLSAFLASSLECIEMFVALDCDPREYETTDIGRKRRLSDLLRVHGNASATAAITTAMYWGAALRQQAGGQRVGARGTQSTESRLIEFYQEHQAPIAFAVEMHSQARTPGLRKAGVFGAIARAWYTVDHADLRIFTAAYSTGIYKEERFTSAAILARAVVQRTTPRKVKGPWRLHEAYRYSAWAINAACVIGKPLSVLRPPNSYLELFPIPNDPQRVAS